MTDKTRSQLQKGVMKLMNDKPYSWVLPYSLILAVGAGASVPFWVMMATMAPMFGLLAIMVIAVFAFVAQFFFLAGKAGKRCEYEFDGEKMTIRRADGREQCFYYSELTFVTIEPFAMIFQQCGYKATVGAKNKITELYYAFSGEFSNTSPGDIPFAMLGDHIPQKADNDNFDYISGDEYRENEKEAQP